MPSSTYFILEGKREESHEKKHFDKKMREKMR
jgi:hypothetical protein